MNFFSTTGFIIIIILTIVNWGIYGLFVRRLYFSREAIWRDIIACFFVAFIEWAIIVWLLAKILIGFLSVLRVIAWIGLIGFSVLIIYVVICIIKKKRAFTHRRRWLSVVLDAEKYVLGVISV